MTLALVISGLPAAPAALAGGLGHRVVLFHSIGGSRIGMSGRQVERRLGRPGQLEHYHHRLNDFYHGQYDLSVSFDVDHASNRVDQIQDDGTGWRTPQGIHEGSSKRALRHAYKGLRCQGGYCEIDRGPELSLSRLETSFLVDTGGKVIGVVVAEPAGYRG